MNTSVIEKQAEILKVLSHPQRLFIIKGLMESHCCVGQIQEKLGLTQTGLSQHLSKLKAAGIIRGTRNKKEICYEVVDPFAIAIVNLTFAQIDPSDIPCPVCGQES